VARDHGHLARVEVKFLEEISAHEIIRVWRQYSSRTQELELPSSPNKPIIFVDGKLDIDVHRWVGSDTKCPSVDPLAAMSVAVGEVEVVGDTLLYTVVADNTIRGAAGYSVLLAELLLVEGILHDSNTILESEQSRLDMSIK
jgi:aspartate-semialdehyde dehydrogenase